MKCSTRFEQRGDDALPTWCYDNLRIGLSVIIETRKVLEKVNSNRVRDELAMARAAERAAKARPSKPTDREVAPRLRVAELEAKLAAAEALSESKPYNGSPQRDRRDYMREFMRRKPAAAKHI